MQYWKCFGTHQQASTLHGFGDPSYTHVTGVNTFKSTTGISI
jgi:hypothetical protein